MFKKCLIPLTCLFVTFYSVSIEICLAMSNSNLKGTYISATIGSKEIYNHNTQDDEVVDSWANTYLLSSEGNGNIIFLEKNGKPVSYPLMPYTVNEHGIILKNGVPNGIISSNGNYFTFVGIDDGSLDDDLVMHIAIKTSSNMSNASLKGTYIMTTIGSKEIYNHSTQDDEVVDSWSDTYLLSSDGNGNITFLEENGEPVSYPQMSYSVNELGIMSKNGVPTGIISSDGNFFTFVSTDDGSLNVDLVMHIGIKTSSDMSNASLKGTYIMTTIGSKKIYNHSTQDDEVVDSWADAYLLSSDGNGNITFLEVNGKPVSYPQMSYSVNKNGIMSKNGIPIGIVNSEGSLFTFCGYDDDSTMKDLVIHLGIKISDRSAVIGDFNGDGIISISDVLLILNKLKVE